MPQAWTAREAVLERQALVEYVKKCIEEAAERQRDRWNVPGRMLIEDLRR
jgi:hypothetical protein